MWGLLLFFAGGSPPVYTLRQPDPRQARVRRK